MTKMLITEESSIFLLGLSPKSRHHLEAENIYTVGDVLRCTSEELVRWVPGFGPNRYCELVLCMRRNGFALDVPADILTDEVFAATKERMQKNLDKIKRDCEIFREVLRCDTIRKAANKFGFTGTRAKQCFDHVFSELHYYLRDTHPDFYLYEKWQKPDPVVLRQDKGYLFTLLDEYISIYEV